MILCQVKGLLRSVRSLARPLFTSPSQKAPLGQLKRVALTGDPNRRDCALRAPKSGDFGVGALNATLNKPFAFVRFAHKSPLHADAARFGLISQKPYLVQFADMEFARGALFDLLYLTITLL